jgi:hypothetical protein
MLYKNILYLFMGLAILSGCSSNKYDIDISDIKIEQNFYRFDQELFAVNLDSVWNYVPGFETKYGSFFDLYNHAVINIGGTNQMDYDDKLVYFITDPYISETQVEVSRIFADEKIKDEIYDAFCHYHYYFPENEIPNIYTFISGFNQSLVIDSGFVAIGLDKYLGSDSKYYSMLRTPLYLRYTMHPAKIPSDVMLSWGLTEFPYASQNDNLSNQMIYYGKMHVFLDAMLPNTPDSIKWGIPTQKLKWCNKNEGQMWLYLIENKLLFNSSLKEIKRFIDDGPFTTPFSKESPARTGQWLGYQIVLSYLKNNNVSLRQLMAMEDYQKILNESKYKP